MQLRVKEFASHQALKREIKESIAIARQHGAKLFINDHWKIALDYGAYGVHLGQEDLNDADIEQIYSAGLRLGISTHCYYEVARAHTFRPSYIACGPIYATTSKIMPFAPQGITQLKRWRRTLNYPLVAIGGIDLSKVPEILTAEVDGIALISAITKAPDPETNAQELLQLINREFEHVFPE